MRIVIDASVAAAASSGPRSPAPECLEALNAVAEGGHRIATSATLEEEWRNHASKTAKVWKRRLHAQRRVDVELGTWNESAGVIKAAGALGPLAHEHVTKDIHLVDLGMLTDRRVLSRDDTQRAFLAEIASARIPNLRFLHWANPCRTDVDVPAWLREGAPEHPALLIAV